MVSQLFARGVSAVARGVTALARGIAVVRVALVGSYRPYSCLCQHANKQDACWMESWESDKHGSRAGPLQYPNCIDLKNL